MMLGIHLESWKWQTDFLFTWLRWLKEEKSIRKTLQLHRGIKEQPTQEESGNTSATTDDLKSRLDSWKEVTKTVISELEREFHLYIMEEDVFVKLKPAIGSLQSYDDVFDGIFRNAQNTTIQNSRNVDRVLGGWTAFKHLITATLYEVSRIKSSRSWSQALCEHIQISKMGHDLSLREEINFL